MNKILLALVLGCSVSSVALAGGYQLQEYSAVNLGRAFGGAGVVGDDYSAIAFNPAGMSLKGTGGQVGGSFMDIRGHGDGLLRTPAGAPASPEGKGKLRTNALLPHFFAQTKAGERVRIGAGVYVPFGLGTYYKKGWYGASHALNSEISVISSAVAASVKVTDELSVGASAFMQYLDARLTNATGTVESDLNADGWKPGYSLGVMYEPVKDTRLGVSYRSKVAHRIKGNHYFHYMGTSGNCGTKLVLPEHVLFSATQKLGDFDVSGIARWTRWKRFSILRIHSEAYPGGNLPEVNEDWRNTWTIGGGVDYHYNPNWTYRAGLAWDQGAVRRPANRTARVPDSNRVQASVGLSYTKSNWQFDVGYMHLFWKRCHSHNQNGATVLDAKYNVRMDILSAGVQYNF